MNDLAFVLLFAIGDREEKHDYLKGAKIMV